MPATGYSPYSIGNILSPSFHLRFCEGENNTLAQAMVSGWKDLEHITATDISPSQETTEHVKVYEGVRSTDKKVVTKSQLEYGITFETMNDYNMALALMGALTTDSTQSVQSSVTFDTFAFTAGSPCGDANTWYNLTASGVQYRDLTAVALTVPALSCVCEADDDTVTLSAHGWSNGTPVKFAGSAVPTGLSGSTVYYIVEATTNTFKVSTSLGGSAVNFTTDGTSVTVQQQLIDSTSVMIDFKTGAVRFLYPVVQTVTPVVSAPAITELTALRGVTPLANVTVIGWFRLLGYDSGDLVYDHVFKGQFNTKGGSGLDGSKAASFQATLTVSEAGTLYVKP